jgi:CHAT domain-containing protein/tetratricopeptide (TPR) repeat protein
MLAIRSRHHSYLAWACLVFCLVWGIPSFTQAQTADETIAKLSPSLGPADAAIMKVVIKGYEAFALKNAPALLSMFSQQSPYLDQFKTFLEEEYAANAKSRFGVSIKSTPRLLIEGDKATAYLDVVIHAVNKDTGKEADGFGATAHTFRFVQENGVWKIWQFSDTAEELTAALLAARTDEERAVVLKNSEPFTDGLLKALSEGAANLLHKRGNDAQASMILNIVLTIARRDNSLLGTANALIGLGDVYAAQGDYLRAADNYQQIMKLVESLSNEEGIAVVSIRFGNIHYYQGNFPQALEYYQKSVKLYEKHGSTEDIAHPLLSIGDTYFAQNNYPQALEYYQRSLKLCEQAFDKGGTAFLLGRIAQVYAAQDRYNEAVDFYQRSLKLQDALGIKSITALSLNGIGAVRYRQGNYAEAVKFSARANELAREGNAPEILWKTWTSLGRAYRALKDLDQAEQAYLRAITVLEKLRGQLVGNEREQELFFENKTIPYVEMVELLLAQNKLADAFRYAELAKGRMLLDVVRNGRADVTKTMTDEERNHEKLLNARITSLGSQLRKESSLANPDRTRLAAIEAQQRTAHLEYDAYETRIYAAHPELKVTRGGAEPITVAEVAPLMRDAQTVLLEYVVAPERTYLFVLTKNGEQANAPTVSVEVYPIAITAAELTERVRRFREQLAGNSLNFKDDSQQLYDLLLRPAQKALAGKTTVCIVPAGGLWELPFQALLSMPGRYFLEDHAVFYAPSLSVLTEIRRKDASRSLRVPAQSDSASVLKVSTTTATPATPDPRAPAATQPALLAMGNPTLSATSLSRAKSNDRSPSLAQLPEAEREVKTLGEIYGLKNSKILTRSEAREETVKAEAGRYPILHFATHGLLDDNNPLYSRLLLVSTGESDDGLLEAREIMKLDLHGDLVVLSACQTARGQISPGEGLVGMSWAFFIAGASTTVVSQWQVDSASTSRLMVDFHRELQTTDKHPAASKAEALRRAALRLMTDPKYRHPFFWSGFVVVGNGM